MQTYDLVLLDLMLPCISVEELLKIIRESRYVSYYYSAKKQGCCTLPMSFMKLRNKKLRVKPPKRLMPCGFDHMASIYGVPGMGDNSVVQIHYALSSRKR